METVELLQARLVNTADVDEAPWNCNVMPADKYAGMKEDMRLAGPAGTDPIHTCLVQGRERKTTCDGAHRLRAARELSWPQMYEVFHPEITTEEQARLFNFKRDYARGDVDAFRLAESFKWWQEKGFTQEQIAKKHGISQEKVSDTILLLRVDGAAKQKLSVIPRGITPSQYEILARAQPTIQQTAAEKIVKEAKRGDVTVEEVRDIVDGLKETYEKEKKLKNAVEQSKFAKCPTCGKPALEATYSGLPWVRCSGPNRYSSDHEWNLQTGKTEKQLIAERSAKARAETFKNRPAPVPHLLKTTHTVEEFRAAAVSFIKKKVAEASDIPDLGYEGLELLFGKKRLTISFGGSEEGEVVLNCEGSGDVFFIAKAKTWKSDSLKDFRTEVDVGSCSDEKEFRAKSKQVVEFLEEYAPRKARK